MTISMLRGRAWCERDRLLIALAALAGLSGCSAREAPSGSGGAGAPLVRSDAPLRLRAEGRGPGAWIELRPLGERSVVGRVEGATTWFDGVAVDTDRVVAEGPASIEELRVLRSARAPHEARWLVERGPEVAALRVRDRRVEALDRDGAVLVQTEPAWAIDARGRTRDVEVALLGPEGGARELRVTAPRDDVAYPLVVDPTWSLAPSDGIRRTLHVAQRLPSGRILVAGGTNPPDTLSVASVYDPATEAWSVTDPMHDRRAYTCAVSLADGRVLVAGGTPIDSNSAMIVPGASSTAEIYDEPTHAWTTTGALAGPRRWHACARLPDGRVLAAGGSLADGTALSTAETYDPTTGAWSSAPSTARAFDRARMILLRDGRALLTSGGLSEIYDPIARAWTRADGLPRQPQLVTQPNGDVLAVGLGPPNAARFELAKGTWTALSPMSRDRTGATLAVLRDGTTLVAAGYDPTAETTLATAELFDPATASFRAVAGEMYYSRVGGLPMALDDGRLLVIGGDATDGTWIGNEYFNAEDGAACTRAEVCASGQCVDGRCCHTACDGACEACDVKGKEGTCSPIDGAPRAEHPTCAPYAACKAGACAATCATDLECSAGNVCLGELARCGPEKGLCDGRDTIHDPRGQKPDVSCAPFACTPAGECQTRCASSGDCAPGAICDVDGRCVAVASSVAGGDDGGCAAGRAGLLGSRGWLGAAASALLGAWIARRRRRALRRAAALGGGLFVLLTVAQARLAHATAWQPAKIPADLRVNATLTPLADGRVLLAGGSAEEALSTAEIYDSKTGKWTRTGQLTAPRTAHAAVRLVDGRVLIAGGRRAVVPEGADPAPYEVSTAELFDPATGKWSRTGAMSAARGVPAAAVLGDGRVLVIGGTGATAKTADLFDPLAGTFTSVGGLQYGRALASVATLPDGSAMVIGGGGGRHTEIFDPKSGAFRAGPDTLAVHVLTPPAILPDGRVFLLGAASTTAELYDPATNAFAKVADAQAITSSHTATVMGDGRVLVIGGNRAGVEILARADVFDPRAGTVRALAGPDAPRFTHEAARLPDGRVLVVGGLGSLDKTVPAVGLPVIYALLDGATCPADSACASGRCVDGVCCESACRDACRACDVPGHVGACVAIDGPPRAAHQTCAPYGLCVGGGCVAACVGDDDCDAEHVCDLAKNSCVSPVATCEADGRTVRDAVTGATKDCAPFGCAPNGTCRVRCASTDECAGGAACDRGVCVAPSVASGDEGGCAVGHPGAGSVGAVAAVGLALALLRRRRGGGNLRP